MAQTSNPGIDINNYARAPRLDTAGTVALVNQLVACAPPSAPEPARRALRRMKRKTTALQEAWAARQRPTRGASVRPVDQLDDNAWGAFHGRLVAYSRLPADKYPGAARAGEIVAAIFPTGLGFLNLEYAAQWAECEQRLKRLHDEGFEADAAKLAGAEFLAHVREAHAAYGEALGIGRRPEPAEDSVDVLAAIREVSDAIVAYSVQLVAMHDPDDDADGSIGRVVRAALRPIDAIREKQSRGGSSTAAEAAAEPAKDAPAAPATASGSSTAPTP